MTKDKSKRLVLPDVLKGLAVLLMIHAHVMEQLVDPLMFESWPGKLAMYVGVFPGAAVFMTVMGYFAGVSGAKSSRMIKRGLILFAGGILLNVVLNISYMIRFIESGYPELIPTCIFGVDILLLAGISLVVIGFLKRISFHPLLLLVLALFVAGITPGINKIVDGIDAGKYLTAFIGGSEKWSYFPVFPWLSYPLAGLAAHALGLKKWTALPSWVKIASIVIVFAGFLAGLKFGYNTAISPALHYHHGMMYFFWNMSILALLVYFLHLMNLDSKPLGTAFLSYMGREVTAIYVIQWILIANIAAWIGKKAMFTGHLVWTLSFVLVSVLLTFVYRRLRSGN